MPWVVLIEAEHRDPAELSGGLRVVGPFYTQGAAETAADDLTPDDVDRWTLLPLEQPPRF